MVSNNSLNLFGENRVRVGKAGQTGGGRDYLTVEPYVISKNAWDISRAKSTQEIWLENAYFQLFPAQKTKIISPTPYRHSTDIDRTMAVGTAVQEKPPEHVLNGLHAKRMRVVKDVSGIRVETIDGEEQLKIHQNKPFMPQSFIPYLFLSAASNPDTVTAYFHKQQNNLSLALRLLSSITLRQNKI